VKASEQTSAGWVRSWLPAIAWAVLISVASTDSFSPEHTGRIITPILHWLFPSASLPTLNLLNHYIRKAAHVVEYFLFSVLVFRVIRGKESGWQLRWAIWALAIAAGYSAFDEFHQSYVPSRTASPWDALLDTFGATAGQVVLWIWYRLPHRDSGTNGGSNSGI
jgi:VanZ family protein